MDVYIDYAPAVLFALTCDPRTIKDGKGKPAIRSRALTGLAESSGGLRGRSCGSYRSYAGVDFDDGSDGQIDRTLVGHASSTSSYSDSMFMEESLRPPRRVNLETDGEGTRPREQIPKAQHGRSYRSLRVTRWRHGDVLQHGQTMSSASRP